MKTGRIEREFSYFYGSAMDSRHSGDYELAELSYDSAMEQLDHAQRFVDRIEEALEAMGVLL